MKLLIFLIACCIWRLTNSQCVVEVGVTNLGLVINCRIKKTGILRVKNLGGVKGYIDLGLTVGDAMGFQPLLEEENRRRSAQARRRSSQGRPPSQLTTSKKSTGNKTRSSNVSSKFRDALTVATNHFQDPKLITAPSASKTRFNLTAVPAPQEYNPTGYPNSYDSNTTLVHESSFQCKEQKYIPGIYADKELGCMVFHACTTHGTTAVTKSFSCPPFTLFDQSILKCNWWFYVDCNSADKLYDSNIPIAKSYQMMKLLDSPLDNNI